MQLLKTFKHQYLQFGQYLPNAFEQKEASCRAIKNYTLNYTKDLFLYTKHTCRSNVNTLYIYKYIHSVMSDSV